MGLGLAIVDRLGKSLGHPVSVRSRPGRGTVFSVEVPLGVADTSATPKPKRRMAGELGGLRVLCLDNEPDILDGMRAMLENWDCVVVTAQSGTAAEDTLTKAENGKQPFSPDIILADYHLDSGQTGLDVLIRLRDLHGVNVPGVIITADRSADTADLIADQGFSLLNKPLRPAKLRALMTRALNRLGSDAAE